MNRGYTIQMYRDFVDRARAYLPDVCLASDFIVGFPTETEDEFQSCKDVIRHARFKNSFHLQVQPPPRHDRDRPLRRRRARRREEA